MGCGDGQETLALAERGLHVTAVDTKPTDELVAKRGSLPVEIVQSDVRKFAIKANFYDIIIAKNILPFHGNKNEVFEVIRNMTQGLRVDGVLYITLFGPRDAWVKTEKEMTFIEYDDAINFLESLSLIMVYKSTEEGMGPL